MLQHPIRTILTILLALTVFAAFAAVTEQEAFQVSQEWQERFNAGDAAGVADLYAEDGLFIMTVPGAEFTFEDPDAEPVGDFHEGRDAIEAMVDDLFAQGFERATIDTFEVIAIHDIAYATGTYEFTNGVEPPMTGRFFVVMVEQDGRWVIDRHVVTPAQPPEEE